MISHAWRYGIDYYQLVELLDAAADFHWRNFSVSEDDPIHHESERRIATVLREQVRHCHAVLMLGGVYGARSHWVPREVELAVSFDKPIIGLRARGDERMSGVVQGAAREMVEWSTESIVTAVRRHAL